MTMTRAEVYVHCLLVFLGTLAACLAYGGGG